MPVVSQAEYHFLQLLKQGGVAQIKGKPLDGQSGESKESHNNIGLTAGERGTRYQNAELRKTWLLPQHADPKPNIKPKPKPKPKPPRPRLLANRYSASKSLLG